MLNTQHRPREPIFLRSTRRYFATAEDLKQLRPDPKVSPYRIPTTLS